MHDDAPEPPDGLAPEDFQIQFVVDRIPMRIRGTLPPGEVEPKDVLPAFQSITNAIVNARIGTVRAFGSSISCKAGCGACCRQMVPISRMEARHLAEVVEAMEPERQEHVRARFAETRRALDEAGVLERIHEIEARGRRAREPDKHEDPRVVSLDYFRVGTDCPFLEEGACSIYEDRPLRCREYVVVTPAAWCGDVVHLTNGSDEPVATVSLPTMPAIGLMDYDDDRQPGDPAYLCLIDALEWVESKKGDEPYRAPAAEIFQAMLRRTFSHVPPTSGGPPPALGTTA